MPAFHARPPLAFEWRVLGSGYQLKAGHSFEGTTRAVGGRGHRGRSHETETVSRDLGVAGVDGKDVRALHVLFEQSGGRWRRLESDMPGFLLEGALSGLGMVQQLSRNGTGLLLAPRALQQGLGGMAARPDPLRLCRALDLMVRYGQLNLATSAGAGARIRRGRRTAAGRARRIASMRSTWRAWSIMPMAVSSRPP